MGHSPYCLVASSTGLKQSIGTDGGVDHQNGSLVQVGPNIRNIYIYIPTDGKLECLFGSSMFGSFGSNEPFPEKNT